MRISDWSSDVCSSDLPAIDRDKGVTRLSVGSNPDRIVPRKIKPHDAGEPRIDQSKTDGFAIMERFFSRKAAVDGNQTADPAGHTGFHGITEEIGRATVRENVCLYV